MARESLGAAEKTTPEGSFLNVQINYIKALPPVQAVSLGGDAFSICIELSDLIKVKPFNKEKEMRTILISYDLTHEQAVDYEKLIEAIKALGSNWAKPLLSVWIVKTEKYPAAVRDTLRNYIHSDDRLYAVDITGADWATWNISPKVTEWLQTANV